MSITPVQNIGSDTSQVIKQYMQNAAQSTPTSQAGVNGVDAALTTTAEVADASGSNGFLNSVADTVYTEIEALSAQLPNVGGEQSAIDAYKQDMVPDNESLSPMAQDGLNKGKDDAVAALSKTFDHAIFMAMVNQVISGVGDTSRTLIRQS